MTTSFKYQYNYKKTITTGHNLTTVRSSILTAYEQ